MHPDNTCGLYEKIWLFWLLAQDIIAHIVLDICMAVFTKGKVQAVCVPPGCQCWCGSREAHYTQCI